MAEPLDPSKWLNPFKETLEGFSRPVRFGLSVVVILTLIIVTIWGPLWPTERRWLNEVLAVALSVLWLATLIDYVPTLPAKEPDEEPVVCRSIKYLALGGRMTPQKKLLIRRYQNDLIPNGKFHLSGQEMKECAASPWEFDRIVLYLFEQFSSKPHACERTKHLCDEKELLDRDNWRHSLAPLHYSVRSVRTALEEAKPEDRSVPSPDQESIRKTLEYLEKHRRLDRDGKIKDNLGAILKLTAAVAAPP